MGRGDAAKDAYREAIERLDRSGAKALLAGGQRGMASYARRMTSRPASRSHDEAARVLRRAGYSEEFIREVLSQLPDPIDLRRDQQILARYDLSPERLTDRMGGSP